MLFRSNTIKRNKCLCENEVDLVNLMELSKNKPSENDLKKAQDRLLKKIKNLCCLCNEDNKLKLLKIKIMDGPPHFICLNCYDELNNEKVKPANEINNKKEINNDLSDYESKDTAIKDKDKDKNIIKKKIFCKICFEEHVSIEDNETKTEHKNFIEKVVKYGEGKFKCCKGKCNIF